MKFKFFILAIIMSTITSTSQSQNFKKEQSAYEHVKAAYAEKEKTVIQLLSDKGLTISNVHILIRILKKKKSFWKFGQKTKQIKAMPYLQRMQSALHRAAPVQNVKKATGKHPKAFIISTASIHSAITISRWA